MNVFIEALSTGDTVLAGLRQHWLDVGKQNTLLLLAGSVLGAAKVQFSKGVINVRGLAVVLQCALWIGLGLRIDGAAVKLVPSCQLGGSEVFAVLRSKGSAIFKIAGDAADHNLRAASATQRENIAEIPCEVRISNSQRRIIAADPVLQKHLHTAPFLFLERPGSKPSHRSLKSLAAASRFERQGASGPGQARRLLGEHGAGSIGTYDFVVAHVQHPDVPVMPGAIASDRQNGVRIDRGHRHVENLKLCSGKARAQQCFEQAWQTEFRLGIAISGRFAENEYSNDVWSFEFGNDQRGWLTSQVRAKKTPAEAVVLNEDFLVLDAGR